VEGLTAFVQAPGVRAVARTFAVSILIPKATVATTTVAVPRAKASCCAEDGDVRAGRANRVSLAAPGPLLR